MNVHQLPYEQLAKAAKDASELAVEAAAAGKREAAAMILYAVDLALGEMAVQLCKGDREMAEKLRRKILGKHKG